ncbi:hypothetical protein [Undibacterium parvum]|nr:hypothetical protein [Undibacterium parvum]
MSKLRVENFSISPDGFAAASAKTIRPNNSAAYQRRRIAPFAI